MPWNDGVYPAWAKTRNPRKINRFYEGLCRKWRAHQESNLGTWLRRPMLYPLSYGPNDGL